MTSTAADAHPEPDLVAWLEAELNGRIRRSRRPNAGGSRTTYLIELGHAAGVVSNVVLRVEGEGSFTGTELSLAREAVAYRALADTGVPVPAVLAETTDGRAIILQYLDGTDNLSALSESERAAVMDDFVDVLVAMHNIDPWTLDLPGFDRPVEAIDHARADIAMWQRLANAIADQDPLCGYAGGWLHANAPRQVARTCFVQGDTGPGNFLALDGRVTGLVDMEFAHVGDPMDDLAWLLMRTDGGPYDQDALLAAYEARSGTSVNRQSVDYYRLAVQYRCAVTTQLAVTRRGGARGWAPYLLVTQRYLDGIAAHLSEQTGVSTAAPVSLEIDPTPRTAMFDQLLGAMRAAVKAIDEPELRETTRNSQIFVHFLRAHDRYGAELHRADERDRRSSGIDPDHHELAVVAARAGREGDTTMLEYLLRRQRRQRHLWQSLLERGP